MRLALLDLVGGEVCGGDEAAVGLLEGGDLLGHRAVVEVVGVWRRCGVSVAASSGCLKVSPAFVEVAVALEDAARGGEVG